MSGDYGAGRCVLPHTREPERPRPARVGFLCVGHAGALEDMLTSVPVLWDAAEEGMIRGPGSGPKITGTRERPLPIDPKLSAAKLMLRDRLASWAFLITEEHPDALHPPRFGVDPCSAFLLRWHEWICSQPWIDDYHAEIRDSVNALRAALEPVHVRRVDVGPCDALVSCDIETHEVATCEGTMRATVTNADDDLPSAIACTECGASFASPEWRALAKRLRGELEHWLTAAQISHLFHVPIGTVWRWASEDEWSRTETRPKRYRLEQAQQSYDHHHIEQREAS